MPCALGRLSSFLFYVFLPRVVCVSLFASLSLCLLGYLDRSQGSPCCLVTYIVVLLVTVLLLRQFFACCPVGFSFLHSCLVRSQLPGIVVLVSLFAVLTVFPLQLCLLTLSVFSSSVSVLVSPYRSACVTVCCCRSLVSAVFLFSQFVLLSPLGCSAL